MKIKKFGVIGAGQMGNGIAQVAAVSGLDVIMSDVSIDFAKKGKETISNNINRMVVKEIIDAKEAVAILARITPTADLAQMAEVDYLVEAAVEREDLKFKLFKDLDRICKKDAILATNTSSIPIGRIAAQTERPEKVIGMHFMNPVPVMTLVEVIRGLATSEQTFISTLSLCEKFKKQPAEASDYPGFLANRILLPMINEAAFCLYQSVGKPEDIDTVMKLGMNHPMGPLELADLIGLDTCLAIMETLYDGFKDSKYRPCPLLRKYVESGWLGRKTGRGFYEYTN